MTRSTRVIRDAVVLAFSGLVLACAAYAQDGPRFAVRGFEIEGELPIPRERALAIVGPYTGESVDLERLQDAVRALESELAARGFPFYRVVLPPQSLEG